MIRRPFLAATLIAATVASAQDAGTPAPAAPPSAEMIREVLDYQENGKDRGPALIELVPCLKVDNTKGSPTAYSCLEPVNGPVPKNTTVFAWLMWLCPKDGKYDDVVIQFLHEGQVRKTVDTPVAGIGRTRAWRGDTFSKVGKWTIKVLRGDKELGSVDVNVAAN